MSLMEFISHYRPDRAGAAAAPSKVHAGEVDCVVQEMEITPKMIEAGVRALKQTLGGEEIGECTIGYPAAAQLVFKKMFSVSAPASKSAEP